MESGRRLSRAVVWWLFLLLSETAAVNSLAYPEKQLDCDSVSVILSFGSTRTTGPSTINHLLNSQFSLICSSAKVNTNDFIWFKNEEKIAYPSLREFKIDSLKSVDGGQYQCAVKVESCGVVLSNPLTINTPPVITDLSGGEGVAEGASFTLTCLASGWPTPHIQWVTRDQLIQNGGEQYTVESAKLSDSGKYTCTATNSRGMVKATKSVFVGVAAGERELRDVAVDSTMSTTPAKKGGGGGLGSSSFIAVILVCVILAIAMIVVVVIVSVLCCIAAGKSCKTWIDEQKSGDKAHLISPDDDNVSEEGDQEKSRKNGSVALAGVAAALTADTQAGNDVVKSKPKKKKPKAGLRSKKIQPQMESDEIPIITNIDDPWPENGEEATGSVDEESGEVEQKKSGQLAVVENGVGEEAVVKESAMTKIDKEEGGEGNQLEVEAEVSPEMLALSIEQQPEIKEDSEAALTSTTERQRKALQEESSEAPPPAPPTSEKTEEEILSEKAKKLGRSLSFVKQLTRSHPLNVSEISQMVYGQEEDADQGDNKTLFAEYNSIPQNTPVLNQSSAEKARNRYRNVLPNPHSAVKLCDLGEDGSTYINANYIQGYRMENAYIVTQGPTGDTMEDFWRMVWEKDVSLIVMLTGIIERGRHKCAKYWPYPGTNEGKMDYGTIHVYNHYEEAGQYYNISKFTISVDQQGSPERDVYHFAYKAWPDFGVPKETTSILNLVEIVNNYRKEQSSAPVVVHCSAGLGRSGAFMAIDMGIHQYEQEGQVDPLKYLCDMRTDRGGTIQTPEQYVFIHKALADYMMARMK